MTDPPPPSGPPPGWYPDPITGSGYRWWDGSSWSDHVTDDPGRRQGPISQLQPVAPWMSRVLSIAASRAGHFLPMIVLLIVPTGLLNGIAVWFGLRDAVLTSDSETGELGFTNPSASAGTYGLMALSLGLSMLAWLLLTLAVARQASAAADGEPEPWSASMLAALQRFPRGLLATAPVLAAFVAVYLAVIVGSALSAGLAVLVVFLAIVALPWLVVRLSLAQVGAGLAPPGERVVTTSWQLTRHRFWAVFGRMAILLLITLVLSLLASFVSAPFTALAGGGAGEIEPGADVVELNDLLGDNPAVFAIGQLFGALGNGASTVVWATGLTLIYRALTGVVDRGDDDRSVHRAES